MNIPHATNTPASPLTKDSPLDTNQAAAELAALGNVTRLRLFRLLIQAGHDGLNVSDLQRLLEQPASTLAHHLAKLTQTGLVTQQRQGREVICTANYTCMNELLVFLTDQCCSGVEIQQVDDVA
ncbi:MAG: helix-turn-helix transcriptional regulator [Candidatus Competibacteraceae bacterium]|nr:helix-turn-helix transcriptional regulator [Candidatus Competibacteraceae bacterium]